MALQNAFGPLALDTSVTALLTQTTGAAILAKLAADPATKASVDAVATVLTSGTAHTDQTSLLAAVQALGTQTTLAAVLAVLGTGPTSLLKAEDTATAAGDRGIASFHKRGATNPVAEVDTAGDYSHSMVDAEGKLVVVQGAIPENTWQSSIDLTATTTTALKAAGATGIRNYLKTLVISNTAATTPAALTLTVSDGATRIGLVRIPATSNPLLAVTFDPPLRGTAATALNVALSAASGTVSLTATGHVGI